MRFHPMQDERDRTIDEGTAGGSPYAADDAVSNRSDDTALEESDLDRRGPVDASNGAQPGDESHEFAAYESEALEEGTAEQPEAEGTHDDVASDEQGVSVEVDAEVDEAVAETPELEERAKARRRPIMEDLPVEEIRMDWYILKV